MRSTLWHGVLPKARIRLREGKSGRRMPGKFASSFSVASILCIRVYVKFMSEYMPNLCQSIYVKFMSEYIQLLEPQIYIYNPLLSSIYWAPTEPSLFFWASSICPPSVRWIYDNKYQKDDVAKNFLDGWMHPSLQTDEHTGMGWARKSACGCLVNRGLILSLMVWYVFW